MRAIVYQKYEVTDVLQILLIPELHEPSPKDLVRIL
jgi:hypothetical protein